MKLLKINKTKSTNDYIKKFIRKKEDVCVIAEEQTLGRGTKGRSFESAKGGIYLSYLRFFDSLEAKDAFSVISDTSVAVVKTLRAFGVKAEIKWPNDILVGGKKICGILTENRIENGKVLYSIIGLGLNVKNELSPSLSDIAVTLKELVPNINYDAVLLTLIFNLPVHSEIGLYVGYSAILGKSIKVIEGENEYSDIAEDILSDGRLKLKSGKILSFGEVKIVPES